jgi:hypothetical protein
MHTDEIMQIMSTIGVGRQELAKLLDVTPRAVNMWCAGDREIPGPVTAYLNLLQSLPNALIARELDRLNEGNNTMYDGMYLVQYEGHAGHGIAVLVFMDGVVFGHDGGVQYDGVYEPSASQSGFMDLRLKLTVSAGVALVQGVPAQPADYNFEITVTIPARGNAPLKVETPYGPVVAQLSFLRPLPSALAA